MLAVDDLGRDRFEAHIWLFPQEEAFRFEGTDMELERIFSQKSSFRKGAAFEGRDHSSGFISGRAMDAQMKHAGRMARFWLEEFLDAHYRVTRTDGTRVLVERLKTAYKAATSVAEKRRIVDAAVGLRASNRRDWSLSEFAEDFLPQDLQDRFLGDLNDRMKTSSFELDKVELRKFAPFRVYKLDGNARVILASEEEPGADLHYTVEGNLLRLEGRIKDESIRSR